LRDLLGERASELLESPLFRSAARGISAPAKGEQTR
jgi:hypothetical protein